MYQSFPWSSEVLLTFFYWLVKPRLLLKCIWAAHWKGHILMGNYRVKVPVAVSWVERRLTFLTGWYSKAENNGKSQERKTFLLFQISLCTNVRIWLWIFSYFRTKRQKTRCQETRPESLLMTEALSHSVEGASSSHTSWTLEPLYLLVWELWTVEGGSRYNHDVTVFSDALPS